MSDYNSNNQYLYLLAQTLGELIKRHRIKIVIFGFISFALFLMLSEFQVRSRARSAKLKPEITIVAPKFIELQKDSIASVRILSSEISKLLKKAKKTKGFNGSVLVAKKGKIVFEKEVGYTNFIDKIELTKESAFQLASVSKQFTAASIMMLVDRNLIGIDDSVICYYPDFPYKNITIRHLLNHTSGLPMYFWVAEHKWDKKMPPSNSEMMDLMIKEKLLPYFWPGRRFDYSNTGYFVLASLVEKVTDMSFKDFVQKNIFQPLEMKDSFIYQYSEDTIRSTQLKGFRRGGRRRYAIGGTVNDRVTGDKNVYSTTHDLLKWINGLNSGKLVSKQSLDEMYTKGFTKKGREVHYGFGFRIVEDERGKLIYHNGTWNGFRTTIRQYQESELVVIVLENSSYRGVSTLANEIQHIVNENYCF